MRRAENALQAAEAWATVDSVVGLRPYPHDELQRAWKQVLFNQFHDTVCGTAIEPAYRDARDQLGEAASIAGRVHNLAIQSLSQLIDIPNDPGVTPIVVFNPLAWPVRTMVELEYGGLKPTEAWSTTTAGTCRSSRSSRMRPSRRGVAGWPSRPRCPRSATGPTP